MFFSRNNIWFLKSIDKKIIFLLFKWNGNEFPMNWETDKKFLKKKGNVCLWWVCNVHVIGLWCIRWIISFWVLCTNSFFGIIVALTWFLFWNTFNFSWWFLAVLVLITSFTPRRFLDLRVSSVATFWTTVWFATTFFFFARWFSRWFATLGATSSFPINSFPFSTVSSLSFIWTRPRTTSLLE